MGAVDLFQKPDLLAQARAEFDMRTAEGFVCPIPSDAKPVIPD